MSHSINSAAYDGDMAAVRRFVEAGATEDVKEVALTEAAGRGRLDVVKYLMEEAGVDKENISMGGWTPLAWAVQTGRTVVMKYLLDQGCGVDVTAHGATPLHHAVSGCRVAAVKFLLLYGASITAVEENGRTPFDYAHDEEIHQLLLDEEKRRRDHGFKRYREDDMYVQEEGPVSKARRLKEEVEEDDDVNDDDYDYQ